MNPTDAVLLANAIEESAILSSSTPWYPRLTNGRHVVFARQDNWYDENYFCSQYVDDTAVFLEIGGCKYDFPMGDCMDIDVDVSDTVRGCASELETHMTDKVRGKHASLINW